MFGLSRKIQSNGKWFPLTVNHAPKPYKIFYNCIFPTINFHPKKIEEREREIAKLARASIAYPSIGESSDCTSKHQRVALQHRRDHRTPEPPRSSPPKTDPPKTDLLLDPKFICAAVLNHHRSRPSIVLSFPQSLDLMNFFFWVLFLNLDHQSIEKWYYIFV